MSHNDIYNQIRRVSTSYPVYRTLMPPVVDENSLVPTQMNTKKKNRDFKESFDVLNKRPLQTVTIADKTEKSYQKTVSFAENTRKGKAVWNHDVEIGNDNILELPEIDSQTSVINKENSNSNVITATAASKAYKVTEDTDKLATEDNYSAEHVEYQYNPPTDESQNLTSTFYKILSKYNINSGEKLQNYDLSLKRKVQSPSANAYRFLLPYGYNNLNHLPVDPLLAVFLSNYGFYLPSLYGIKANYNNLYGYLASNNIHNNKPFGMYKVFSDTDSWN